MTRIALILLVAGVSMAPHPVETGAGGVRDPAARQPVTRVCYLDLAAEHAARCALPPKPAAS